MPRYVMARAARPLKQRGCCFVSSCFSTITRLSRHHRRCTAIAASLDLAASRNWHRHLGSRVRSAVSLTLPRIAIRDHRNIY